MVLWRNILIQIQFGFCKVKPNAGLFPYCSMYGNRCRYIESYLSRYYLGVSGGAQASNFPTSNSVKTWTYSPWFNNLPLAAWRTSLNWHTEPTFSSACICVVWWSWSLGRPCIYCRARWWRRHRWQSSCSQQPGIAGESPVWRSGRCAAPFRTEWGWTSAATVCMKENN